MVLNEKRLQKVVFISGRYNPKPLSKTKNHTLTKNECKHKKI